MLAKPSKYPSGCPGGILVTLLASSLALPLPLVTLCVG